MQPCVEIGWSRFARRSSAWLDPRTRRGFVRLYRTMAVGYALFIVLGIVQLVLMARGHRWHDLTAWRTLLTFLVMGIGFLAYSLARLARARRTVDDDELRLFPSYALRLEPGRVCFPGQAGRGAATSWPAGETRLRVRGGTLLLTGPDGARRGFKARALDRDLSEVVAMLRAHGVPEEPHG